MTEVVSFETLYAEPSKNGLTRPKRVRGDGYKMVNMGELFAYDRIKNPPMDLVPMSANEIGKFDVRLGDLLFARQSLIAEGAGKCSIVLSVPEITTFESHLIRVRLNRNVADPLFYFYYFSSPVGKGNVQSLVMQVAAAGIRGSELAKLKVPKLPLSEQRRIASILSAYDDLIENNTRRIAILEEMARRIYEEWFVHFRFPGHEHVRMVESELGPVPDGWAFKPLGDLVEDVRDAVDPGLLDSDSPYVGLEHLPRRSIALSEWGEAGAVQSTKLRFREGDILFGKIRPYFHKVVVAPVSGVASSDAIILRPTRTSCFALALSVVSSDAFVAHATQTSNGTKMPRANWNVLQEYPVVVPVDGLKAQFDRLVNNSVAAIQNFVRQNRNLRTTRDLLLPKLISGELDVSALPEPAAVAA